MTRQRKDEEVEILIREHKRGCTVADLARAKGCSQTNIYQLFWRRDYRPCRPKPDLSQNPDYEDRVDRDKF